MRKKKPFSVNGAGTTEYPHTEQRPLTSHRMQKQNKTKKTPNLKMGQRPK